MRRTPVEPVVHDREGILIAELDDIGDVLVARPVAADRRRVPCSLLPQDLQTTRAPHSRHAHPGDDHESGGSTMTVTTANTTASP